MNKFVMSAVALAAVVGANASSVLTQWDFNNPENPTSNNTGTLSPSTGSGSVGLVGGVASTPGNPQFNSGNGSSDPVQPGAGFQTLNYPDQGTASGTAGLEVRTSTEGFFNVQVSFDLRLSNTSSRWFQFEYTTDGDNFVAFGSPVRLGEEPNAGDTWFNGNLFDLSAVSEVNDNANFGFRIVSVFSPVAFTQLSGDVQYGANEAYEVARNTGQSQYAGGTWRFDMVTVSAEPIPEPATMIALGLGAAAFAARRRRQA